MGKRLFLKVRQEPLLLFLLIGFLLFAAHRMFSSATGIDNPAVIDVDRAAMLRFTQFRSKVFNEEGADRAWTMMPAAEKKAMLDQFIREEALYREALAWGLDRDDYVIRRRLVQSLEFALGNEGGAPVQLSEQQLRRFYADHPELYRERATISFSHMFFAKDKGGMANAQARAQAALALIRRGTTDPATIGDRFVYFANYARQGEDMLAGHFGAAMARQLLTLKAGPQWQGPITSDHGVHLVRVQAIHSAGLPPFETVRAKVESDAATAARQRMQEEAIQRIVASYRLRVTPEFEGLR